MTPWISRDGIMLCILLDALSPVPGTSYKGLIDAMGFVRRKGGLRESEVGD